MIDLKDAAAFLRLCETSNLTRTATLCNVSPSTLSRTLNKLEKDLNAKVLCDTINTLLDDENKLSLMRNKAKK